MSEVILDTITGKSTATTVTIGSTPVVSASANSMTIRGEGSNQTSIQQGLAKVWSCVEQGTTAFDDSFNCSGITDEAVPCGLQIIGRPCDDVTVFQIGAALEQLQPWAASPDKWPPLSSMTKI